MNLVTLFLVMFFFLGILVGPLAYAAATVAYSEERGKRLADRAFSIGLKSVWRPSLTFNAADELTLKRRSYDEEHDEQKITFGGMFSGVERYIFDPQNRIHDFFGTPFAFVDERFGICLDPRDSIIGRELSNEQSSGTYTIRVERGQRLVEGVLGVFELPRKHVGARLPDVWTLVGGSFDAQLVRKIHEFYRKGQAPKTKTTALRQLLVPIGAFVAVVLLGMFAAGQSGGGGGGAAAPSGGANRTVQIGSLALLMVSLNKPDINYRDAAVTIAMLGIVGAIGAVLYFAFPVWVSLVGIPLPLGVWSGILFVVGAGMLPIIAAWFGRALGPIGLLLGKLWITIGLLPYNRPVISLIGENRYDILEYNEENWPVKPQFYRFALTRIGVGATIDAWSDDVIESPASIEEMARTAPDGGASPPGYLMTELIQQDDINGFVPEGVDDNLYIRTDLTTGWFAEAGQNRRLMQAALETAKEKYGGGQKPVGDKWIMAATLVAMAMGAVFDYLVFF